MGKGDPDQAVVEGTRRGWYWVTARNRTENTWRLGVGHGGQVGAKSLKKTPEFKKYIQFLWKIWNNKEKCKLKKWNKNKSANLQKYENLEEKLVWKSKLIFKLKFVATRGY